MHGLTAGGMDYGLDVAVPPDGIGAIEYIRLSEDYEPGLAAARLLVWPKHIGMNPAMDTAEFFRAHYPDEQPEAFGPHTLIVGLRPNQSIVVPPYESAAKWRWTHAMLDLKAPYPNGLVEGRSYEVLPYPTEWGVTGESDENCP